MTELDKGTLRYLCSLVRMDIRSKERGLAKFRVHPNQTLEEGAEIRDKLEANLAWRRTVLEQLGGGSPRSDSPPMHSLSTD